MALDYPDFYTRARLKGYESRVYQVDQDLAEGETVTVIKLPGLDLELETLEWATDVKGDPDGGVGTLFMLPATYDIYLNLSAVLKLPAKDVVFTGLAGICPATLNKWKSDIWELLNYDTTNNRYKIGLRRQLRLSHGFLLRFWNYKTGATQRVVLQAVITILGE